MSDDTFYAKRGDTRPIRALLTTPGGTVPNFTGHSVRFHLSDKKGNLKIDAAGSIFASAQTDVDGNSYNVQYNFTASDLDLPPGPYRVEWEVTDGSGVITTYPSDDYNTLYITEDLD